MLIRDATTNDWPDIFPIFAGVIDEGRTYTYPEGLSSKGAQDLWMLKPPGRTVVAVEDGVMVGTATMSPNRPGRGSHIATASFMVDANTRSRGIGRALGEHMLAWAKAHGFRGVQFNAVVETNEAVVRLWQSLGFEIIGTVPGAFSHPDSGYVGLHVMFRSIT